MIIRVDAELPMPVYEQIREQVTRMAVAGTMPEGTRMPTIRQLANDLALAKGTVAKAYSLLEASGIVESRGHRGTFVASVAQEDGIASETVATDLAHAADAFVIAARQLGVSEEAAAEAVRTRWIDT